MLNIGSITKIEITLAENITLGTPNDDNEVSVTNSGTWDEPEFTTQTAGFTQNEKLSEAGLYYEQQLNFTLPKTGTGNHQDAYQYADKPVVIRITDGNGNIRILGSADKPVFIRKAEKIPAEAAGLNAYYFEVKTQNTHPAYFSA